MPDATFDENSTEPGQKLQTSGRNLAPSPEPPSVGVLHNLLHISIFSTYTSAKSSLSAFAVRTQGPLRGGKAQLCGPPLVHEVTRNERLA